MSGLINLIKSIFGFIAGLFGGKKAIEGNKPKAKKGNGYFLELDETKSLSATPAASTPAPNAVSTPAPTAEQPMTIASTAIAEAETPAATSNGKKSTRKQKLAALAAANNSPNTPSPESADGAAVPQPQPTPMVDTLPVPDTAFATKYLVPSNNGTRRRPGANMSPFLDMARSVNPTG